MLEYCYIIIISLIIAWKIEPLLHLYYGYILIFLSSEKKNIFKKMQFIQFLKYIK